MEHPEIPEEISQFLKKHIDSVMQLEVLLMMHARPEKAWLASEVAAELRIDPRWTEATLARFANAGILDRREAAYQFAPADAKLGQTVARIADLYEQRRVTIIGIIFSEPDDPIRKFTDAFRFRKDE